jgi:pimeloyl-ACP methyl ester carboxylesterase
MLVAGRRRFARAAKDFPLAHALFAIATFVAVCGKVLADTPGTKLDFARQFDIGAGRKLFLECRGAAPAGYPTVVLISGYHGSSDSWTQPDDLSLLPLAVGPAVLPGLARENRVCAYDRPGTMRAMADAPLTDRSTPVAQPRTVRDLVSELHGLLSAAQVPTPYVLVGHSLGGLIALLYARTYSSDVRGIVFIDALSPTLPIQLGALWPLYLRVLNPPFCSVASRTPYSAAFAILLFACAELAPASSLLHPDRRSARQLRAGSRGVDRARFLSH